MAFTELRSFAHSNRRDLRGAEEWKPEGRAHTLAFTQTVAVGEEGAPKRYSAISL